MSSLKLIANVIPHKGKLLIGCDNDLVLKLYADLSHFKKTTTGGVCVMGRYTYEDMLAMRIGRGTPAKTFVLLPNRDSYVVSSNKDLTVTGGARVADLGAVMQKYKNTDREIFVIGGRRMFIEALTYKPVIYMTIIKGSTYDCDVSFPLDFHDHYTITDGRETEHCYYVKYESV